MSYQLKKQVLREHAIHWALKLWHKLPLDESFRSKIKYILFTYFSLFFKNTSKYKRWISFNKNIPIQDITQENESQDILKVAFDTTINKFVEYQENQAINPLVKLIAFYLPQFHPFPENDKWWGKGFTEWSNVGKALPNYVGHYQPHCPIHLGYYDLRIPEIMEEQAKLAKAYGVYGFNYYFYWFAGKVLMEKPLEMMLENKKVDIPFCLTWANENWTRRWDGLENDVLIAQNHSKEDSLEFIRYLIKYFKDERYILIDGKPLLIVYRANIIPDIYAIADSWRKEVRLHGFPDLYLVAAQTLLTRRSLILMRLCNFLRMHFLVAALILRLNCLIQISKVIFIVMKQHQELMLSVRQNLITNYLDQRCFLGTIQHENKTIAIYFMILVCCGINNGFRL